MVGDRWTLLLVREVLLGTRRFDEFLSRLGLPRTVLAERLRRLVANGILERVAYQERPPRYEYRLTEKGRDLWPVLSALRAFGDRHLMAGRPPIVVRHRGCGGEVTDRRTCASCGAPLELEDVEARPGPGAVRAATGR